MKPPGVGVGVCPGVWVGGKAPGLTPNAPAAGGRPVAASASRGHRTYQVQLSGAYRPRAPVFNTTAAPPRTYVGSAGGSGPERFQGAPRAARTPPPRGTPAERDTPAADRRRPATRGYSAHRGRSFAGSYSGNSNSPCMNSGGRCSIALPFAARQNMPGPTWNTRSIAFFCSRVRCFKNSSFVLAFASPTSLR